MAAGDLSYFGNRSVNRFRQHRKNGILVKQRIAQRETRQVVFHPDARPCHYMHWHKFSTELLQRSPGTEKDKSQHILKP